MVVVDNVFAFQRVPMIFVGRLPKGQTAKVEATAVVIRSVTEALEVIRKGEGKNTSARSFFVSRPVPRKC